MSEEENARAVQRYIALDIHKHYCVVAGVDREGRVLLTAVCVESTDLEGCLWIEFLLQNHPKKKKSRCLLHDSGLFSSIFSASP